MDVADQIGLGPEERLERRLALDPSQQAAVVILISSIFGVLHSFPSKLPRIAVNMPLVSTDRNFLQAFLPDLFRRSEHSSAIVAPLCRRGFLLREVHCRSVETAPQASL